MERTFGLAVTTLVLIICSRFSHRLNSDGISIRSRILRTNDDVRRARPEDFVLRMTVSICFD
jgi:hypothetical protein